MLAGVQRITSRRNAMIEHYRAVGRGDEAGLLLDGSRMVHEALASDVRLTSVLIRTDALQRASVRSLVARLEQRRVDVVSVTDAVLTAASPVQSPASMVALAEPRHVSPDAPYRGTAPSVLVACDIQDPGNLGAMARVCEAAGASGLVAAGRGADPLGWKALRGSMGSALRLPVVRHETVDQALAQARTHGCRVLATVPRDGRPLSTANLAAPLAIFVGGEGSGLPACVLDAADERLTVPMEPPVESLNAAITAALVLYEARRQRC
jgi:RNA methyltransferase, TrmH family